MIETIKKGFYVHHKGGIYFVHGLARDEFDNTIVVYESTQSCGDEIVQTTIEPGVLRVVDTSPRSRYRHARNFIELVDPTTGEPCGDGHGIPRFQRVVGWLKGTPLVNDQTRRAIPFVSTYIKS